MKLQAIVRATSPHKWKAIFDDGTHTNFGYKPMEDYTQHNDKERRRLYRQRHRKDLDTKDPRRAGFLAFYTLWGDSTDMSKNIRDYKKRFNL